MSELTSAYDTLINALPDIAEAIAIFASPEVQSRAFDALAASLIGAAGPSNQPDLDLQRKANTRLGAPTGTSSATPSGSTTSAASALSVGEFLVETGASRMPDKITAIAMWLIDAKGTASVMKDEVKAEFRNAGEAVPGKNYSRDFNSAISLKFLAPESGGDGKSYYVTRTGRTAVDGKFAAEVRKAVPRRPPRKKQAAGADN